MNIYEYFTVYLHHFSFLGLFGDPEVGFSLIVGGNVVANDDGGNIGINCNIDHCELP
jgi:hypothetical protein